MTGNVISGVDAYVCCTN